MQHNDRQRNVGRGLDSIVHTLNRDGITPFSCLEGVFPVINTAPDQDSRLELSLPKVREVSRRSEPLPNKSTKMKASQVGELLASYNVVRASTKYETPMAARNDSQKRSNSAPYGEL